MVIRDERFRNKFIIIDGYCKPRELKKILSKYDEVRCIICNAKTSQSFIYPSLPRSLFRNNIPITIRNRLMDGVFYVNGVY